MRNTTAGFAKNIPDRPVLDMQHHQKLIWVAVSAPGDIVTSFSANGRQFEAYMTRPRALDSKADTGALLRKQGYTDIRLIIARCTTTKLPYAALQFYSHGGSAPFMIKTFDVDVHHQRRGIGTAFYRAVKAIGIDLQPGNKYTTAGAAFLNKMSF